MKANSDVDAGGSGVPGGEEGRALERADTSSLRASGAVSAVGRDAAAAPRTTTSLVTDALDGAEGDATERRRRAFDQPTAEDADLAAMVGRRIGAYEITGLLARGGMGIVFSGRDTRLQRPVAIKALPRAVTDDPGQRARLRREAKLLASISHPNIATVYGLEQDDADYLVMELVVGSTLSERLSRGPLPVMEALPLALQIGRGVEAAHEAALIHRDLKPSNVLLTRDGKAKLVDFGIARAVKPDADDAPPLSAATLTLPFIILGTPGYMSPEQIRGRGVDRRADIFAFGVLLYECLTGEVAFPGETVADRLATTLEREPDMALVSPEVPPRVVDLLRRCLAKDPARRLPDIGLACQEIEEALLELRQTRATLPSSPAHAARAGNAAAAAAPAGGAAALVPGPASGAAAPAPAGGAAAAVPGPASGAAAPAPAGGAAAAVPAPVAGSAAAPPPAAAVAPAGSLAAARAPAGRPSAPAPAGPAGRPSAAAPLPAGRPSSAAAASSVAAPSSVPPPSAGRPSATPPLSAGRPSAAPLPAGRPSSVPPPPGSRAALAPAGRPSGALAPSGRSSAVPPEPAPARAARAAGRRRLALAAAGAALVGAATSAGLLRALETPAPGPPARQFDLLYPAPQAPLTRLRLAVSDDGSRVVFGAAGADGVFGLWYRSLAEGSAALLPGTEEGWDPTLSPDGEWVAFYRGGELWKRRVLGGNSERLSSAAWSAGAAWGTDGFVSFFPEWGRGLARIPAQGGDFRFVSEVRPDLGDYAQVLPCVLPDNRAVLFTSWGGKKDTRIEVLDLSTGARATVVQSGSTPRFARTPRGDHLLWERKGTIYAARFDVGALRLAGPEHAIVDGVLTDGTDYASFFDVSDEGTLVWVPGAVFHEESQLAWLGDDGKTSPFIDDPLPFAEPRFSADGKKLSVVLKEDTYTAYVREEARGIFDRVVFDNEVESAAISPDGTWLAFSGMRGGRFGAWVKSLATGEERRLADGLINFALAVDWSPDGRHIALSMSPDGRSPRDIRVFSLDDARPRDLIVGPSDDRYPRFSRDGRWLAYTSDEAGVRQVYVVSFPDGKVKRQISPREGTEPAWSPDGARVYYRADGKLHAAPVSPLDARPVGPPLVIYDKPFGQADPDLQSYTVAPDGRILLVAPALPRTQVTHLRVMLSWHQRLP
ncbi:protein kinase domain-containing protein [Sorangium sp. So ce1335]|uniref:protein kinase domain-containing protein n=1 Tax=Sorangium sp. So ce1335 TaxID=3133335 RepID=UPI003F6384C8